MLTPRAISVLLLCSALASATPAPDQPAVLPFFVYNHYSLIRTRLDPIVNPGKISGHTHAFSGANRVTADGNFASVSAATCTTAQITIDKSLYWSPQLYYKDEQGKFTALSGDGAVSYWFYHRGVGDAESFPELPDDFRVVAGSLKRNSLDMTRALDQAVSFQCFGPGYDLRLPYIPADVECETIRPQVSFPNCWDGVNAYKADGSHVVYGEGDYLYGKCPPGFKRIPTLFLETVYKPAMMLGAKYKWRPGCLVLSHGDNFGLTFHADWLNGFPKGALNVAFDQCRTIFDRTADSCPYLAKFIQPMPARDCTVSGHIIDEAVGIDTPLARLPGSNAEFNSSALAGKPKIIDTSYVDDAKIVKINPANGGICKTNKCTDYKGTTSAAGEILPDSPVSGGGGGGGGGGPRGTTLIAEKTIGGSVPPVIVTIFETIYVTATNAPIATTISASSTMTTTSNRPIIGVTTTQRPEPTHNPQPGDPCVRRRNGKRMMQCL